MDVIQIGNRSDRANDNFKRKYRKFVNFHYQYLKIIYNIYL